MSEIAKRLKMVQPMMGKAKLEEDPEGTLVEYSQIMTQLAEDLREMKEMKVLNKDLEEKLATKEKESTAQKSQIEEMRGLLEKAMTTITSLEEKQEEMKQVIEHTQAATAQTMVNLPQLKPLEEIIENAEPGKSVIEVWGQAVWKQLSPEMQAEIITVYANALVDPQVVEAQMEVLQTMYEQGKLNPEFLAETPAGEQDLYTEVQAGSNIPQETGSNITKTPQESGNN